MGFTDVELAILSYFSFYSLADSDTKTDFGAYFAKHEKSLILNLGDEYKDAVCHLARKVSGGGYDLILRRNDRDGTGFAAFAVADPSGCVTVACRGTEGFIGTENGKKDIKADLQLAYMNCTQQQSVMLDFLNTLTKKGYTEYCFTGHSLGGNLALFGALMLKNRGSLYSCVTFNAPGFNKTFLNIYADRVSEIESRIRNYQNECDGISNAFYIPGEKIILECKGFDYFHKDGFTAHFMDMFVIEDGVFKKNRTGLKDITISGAIIDAVTFITDNIITPQDSKCKEMDKNEQCTTA